MKQVVNLNKVRKQQSRAEAKAQADANAVKFGRTKAQRMLEAARTDKARKMLDQHGVDEQ